MKLQKSKIVRAIAIVSAVLLLISAVFQIALNFGKTVCAEDTLSTDGTVTVVIDKDGTKTTATMKLGIIADNKPNVSGYQFVEARYGDANVESVYLDKTINGYFVKTKDTNITGNVLDSGNIVLYYTEKHTDYDVTFNVKLDGTSIYNGKGSFENHNEQLKSVLYLSANDVARSGQTYNFMAQPNNGYNLSSIVASNGTLSKSGNKYALKSFNSNTTITINLTEIKTYTVAFRGSNTSYIFGGSTFYSYSGSTHGITTTKTYTAGNTFTFDLVGAHEWSSNPKVMNKLTFTIDGVVTSAKIPDDFNVPMTTELENGTVISVTKSANRSLPKYKVVLTAPTGRKIRGNIEIDTNFKDTTNSEVWAIQNDGVEPIAYYGYNYAISKNMLVITDGNGEKNSRLDPAVFTFYERWPGPGYSSPGATYYFFKLNGKYDLSELNFEARNYDDIAGTYTVLKSVKLSELPTIASMPTSYVGGSTNKNTLINKGYTYYYEIPAGTSYTDVKLYVITDNQKSKYKVKYDYNGGINGTDTGPLNDANTYLAGDSFVVSNLTGLAFEGHTFKGWQLGDRLYTPGEVIEINDEITSLAESGTITLKAVWEKDGAEKHGSYVVNCFFADKNGSYSATPNITTEEDGVLQKAIHFNKDNSIYQDWISNNIGDDWKLKYKFDYVVNTDVVDESGNAKVNVYYKLFPEYKLSIGKEIENGEYTSKDSTYDIQIKLKNNWGENVNGKYFGTTFTDGIGIVHIKADEIITETLCEGYVFSVEEVNVEDNVKEVIYKLDGTEVASATTHTLNKNMDFRITNCMKELINTGRTNSLGTLVILISVLAVCGIVWIWISRKIK